MQPTKPETEISVKVFICHAHADQELCKKLDEHLSSLKHSQKITTWQDQEIIPGDDRSDEIMARLEEANVILLLMSASFMASHDCWEEQVKSVLERHRAGTARVIPIILRPVDWKNPPLGRLQHLPTGDKAVTEWGDPDAALLNVAQGIRKLVENLPTVLQKEVQREAQKREEIRKIKNTIEEAHRLIEKDIINVKDMIGRQQKRKEELEAGKEELEAELQRINTSNEPLPLSPRAQEINRKNRPFSLLVKAVDSKPSYRLLSLVLVILLVITLLLPLAFSMLFSNPIGPDGIGVKLVEGEYIGISDGRYAFDTKRDAGSLMLEASKSLREGDLRNAVKKWKEAHEKETNNAEPLIYAENQRVLASGDPYMTLVLGVSFGGDGFSRDALQGAYIAQKQCNENPQQLSAGKKLRLLIARSGSDPARSEDVARQIVQAVQADKTIVGVVGWTTSVATLSALRTLEQAHLPVVAPNTASKRLTGVSPYFFRIESPVSEIIPLAVNYIEKQLAPQRLVIFRDPHDPYSFEASDAFAQKYKKDGFPIAATLDFQTGDEAELTRLVQSAFEQYHPDHIYIPTSTGDDIITLLNAVPTSAEYENLKVLTGVEGYELVHTGKKFIKGHTRMIISSSAYPDEWSLLAPGKKPAPKFFEDYPAAYDPHNQHFDFPYGYRRANGGTMMAYDAVYAFLVASKNAIQQEKQDPTPEEIRNALSQMNDSQPFQGITGAISFGSDGDPINRVHLVLRVVKNEKGENVHRVAAYEGCLLVNDPGCDGEIHILE